MSNSLWPCGLQHARLLCPPITNSWSLLKFVSAESVMPSNHLILCHPLLLLPSVFPSIRVFPTKSALLFRWPENWSFILSINPPNAYSGLISFRSDWFDLLATQGTLKSLLQHHKSSILQCSAIFRAWDPSLQLCPALCDHMDCSPPASSGASAWILQARILEWVVITSSRVSSRPRDWTWVSCIAGRFLSHWPTGKAPGILGSL